MRKFAVAASACLLAASLLLAGCNGNAAKINEEIQLPIYENNTVNYKTASAEVMDLTSTVPVAASIGYLYGDTLYSEVSGNLLEFSVVANQKVSEGDVLAVIDSSSLDYEYNNQKIQSESAYAAYLSSGSESARLKYEIEQGKLDQIQYEIDRYTIRAPYDGVISGIKRYEVGAVIEVGSEICSIARENEVYVYTDQSGEKFSFGMPVSVKIGTYAYTGHVVGSSKDAPRDAYYPMSDLTVVALDDGVLEKMNEEIPNAVSAGWATIYVNEAEKYNVLTVPDSAVKKYSSEVYVSIIENGERLSLPVEVGDSLNGYTIIKSGISAGDTVVLG